MPTGPLPAQSTSDQAQKSKQNPHLICDNCGHYPLQPMHGHYICLACYLPTKCCEGAPCLLPPQQPKPKSQDNSAVDG